jgi:hypothetical protein
MHNGDTDSVGLPLPGISAFTRVFDALCGERWRSASLNSITEITPDWDLCKMSNLTASADP